MTPFPLRRLNKLPRAEGRFPAAIPADFLAVALKIKHIKQKENVQIGISTNLHIFQFLIIY